VPGSVRRFFRFVRRWGDSIDAQLAGQWDLAVGDRVGTRDLLTQTTGKYTGRIVSKKRTLGMTTWLIDWDQPSRWRGRGQRQRVQRRGLAGLVRLPDTLPDGLNGPTIES
jgi:hypothetical protein